MNHSKNKKRTIYWIILFTVFFLILLGLFTIYMNSENFRENIKAILIGQLEKGLGKKIEIGSVNSVSFRSIHLNHFIIYEDSSSNTENTNGILFQAKQAKATFNLFFSLFRWKDWQLFIGDITFYQASVDITRDLKGEFDFLQKLQLDSEQLSQNLLIARIRFQDSYLTYHDQLVFNYDQDNLTTRVKNINGYLDLTQLPQIIFDFQGTREKDDTSLTLQGNVWINQPEYTLEFYLENADITHYQYYLDISEEFNLTGGTFDLNLNLKSSPQINSGELSWQGNTIFRQVDAKPRFLHDIPFRQISGTAQFSKPEINITGLQGLYRNKKAQLEGIITIEPEVYFDLDIQSETVDASSLKEDISLFVPDYNDFSLQGKIGLNGKLKGRLDNFQIEGKAFSPELKVEEIVFQNSLGSFLLDQKRLLIHSLSIGDLSSSLTLNGEMDWSGQMPLYRFSLATEGLPLPNPLFKQFLFPEDLSGTIDSRFEIENQAQNSSAWRIKGQLTANTLKKGEILLSNLLQGDIEASLHLSDHFLIIDQSKWISGKDRGLLSGKISFPDLIDLDLGFEASIPQITELASSLGLADDTSIPTGNARIEGNLNGQLQNPQITAEFQLQELSIQNSFLGQLTGKMTYQTDTITLGDLLFTNQDIRLTADGSIALSESTLPRINLSYQLENMAINPLARVISQDIPLSGQLSGNGQIEGTWPTLAIGGNLQFDQLTYHDYLLGQGKLRFDLVPQPENMDENLEKGLDQLLSMIGQPYLLNISDLRLENEMMELTAEGQAKIGNNYDFSLTADLSHQDFNHMAEDLFVIDNQIKLFLPSQISGKASLNGDINEQQLSLNAQLIPQKQEGNPPSRFEAVIHANGQGITISVLRLIQSEGILEAEGTIAPDQTLDILFRAKQLDLGSLVNLAQINETASGILNVEGSCQGTIDQPRVLMSAQIKEGYFRDFQFKDLQSDLGWDSQTNEIQIKEFVVALEENYNIQARGNLPLNTLLGKDQDQTGLTNLYQELPLDFEIMMEKANLAVLNLLWKDGFSGIEGNMDIQLYLSGTSREPVVNGMVEILQGTIIFNDLPITVDRLNTRIEISDNQVIVPSIPFSFLGNRFNITGGFELLRLLPENIALTIENEQENISYPDILESKGDFKAQITGTLADPQLKGNLFLKQGELDLNQLMQLNVDEIFSSSSSLPQADKPSEFELNIEINDPFTLKLPNANINLTGRIALGGSFSSPSVEGSLVLKKGYLVYFEKRFVLSEGRIAMSGFDLADIEISAKAQTTVGDIEININASGNLADPQILLSSQPALRRTEIISLLTFGRNIEGLSEGEISQVLSQEMLDIIFQSLQINFFKRIERELAEGLGLDFLRLSTENMGTSENPFSLLDGLELEDLRLEVGKSIRDDIFITYSAPLDFKSGSSLDIDYQISPELSLNTEFDTFSIKDQDYRFKFGLEITF